MLLAWNNKYNVCRMWYLLQSVHNYYQCIAVWMNAQCNQTVRIHWLELCSFLQTAERIVQERWKWNKGIAFQRRGGDQHALRRGTVYKSQVRMAVWRKSSILSKGLVAFTRTSSVCRIVQFGHYRTKRAWLSVEWWRKEFSGSHVI